MTTSQVERAAILRRLRPLRGRGAVLAHGLVFLALFVWAFAVFDAARLRVTFHGDESLKIATSRYFGHFFLDRDFADPAWNRSHETLTQPPGFRYILGAGLWLQGHQLDRLNQPYNWRDPEGQNRREGRVPTEAVLMDARRVAVLFSAGALALLYVVGVLLGAPLAGVVAALLAGASPYLREHFARALAEGPVTFFMLAGLALALAAFRRPAGAFGVRSGVGVGLALGLALLTKLTAILSAPALALACPAAALAARADGERRGWWRPLVWGGGVAVACWGLFVALNPFLWPAPPERAVAMFRYRQFEMDRQMRNHPNVAVRDLRDRLALVLDRSLVRRTWTSSALRVPLDAPLAAVGLVSLGAAAWRDWRGARLFGPAALFLLWLLSYLAGIAWSYGYDQPRYVAPLFPLAALLTGLGVQSLLDRAMKLGAWAYTQARTVRGAPQPRISTSVRTRT